MAIAVKVEGLSKRFVLGRTFERTLSSRLADVFRGRNVFRRAAPKEEFWALQDVDFEVSEGQAIAIIGGNGAGKSTLLKVLSRITAPTSGRALVRGRLSSLLEVGTGFHPELTGRENVFLNGAILGMRHAEVIRKFDEIVAFAGVEQFIDTPVKRYSSGMYVRLAFAVAAHLEPDVLIIDEVLAVGDAEFQKRCLGKMSDVASQGRTVIFVSHNMAAVQRLCSRAIWLNHGRVAGEGLSSDIVHRYLEATGSQHQQSSAAPPGYLYWNESELGEEAEAWVHSVRLLTADGEAVPGLGTWSSARVRIEFEVRKRYRAFSAVLQVSTLDGVPLILTSTAPDQSLSFSAEPGRYCIECEFERFPLAAGEYYLGVGLAIPGVEYVWRNENLCRLVVDPQDVFASGLPPACNRYLVATPHQWRPPTFNALD